MGGCFVYIHRRIIELRRKYSEPGRCLHLIFNKSRYVYTFLVAGGIAVICYPRGIGRFMAETSNQQINHLFTNHPLECQEPWSDGNLMLDLFVFTLIKFFLVAIASSLPIPAGVFVPVFVLGAAFGRFHGEVMSHIFPHGIYPNSNQSLLDYGYNASSCDAIPSSRIIPGGYAVVGAAAMAGAVTHTISTSVIVFELTGQMHHILPVMIAVLIANAVSQKLGPSIYDSVLQIQNLPYIPDLRRGKSYTMPIKDVMVREVQYISLQCTYERVTMLLKQCDDTVFPIVDSPQTKILMGAVRRTQLNEMINSYLDFDVFHEEGGRGHLGTYVHYDSDGESGGQMQGRLPTRQPMAMNSAEQMQQRINLRGIQFDPSPFQLVAQTSLYKVHTLFSLLGVTIAYVTEGGRLVGLVGPDEVRNGIQRVAATRRLEKKRQEEVHPSRNINWTTMTSGSEADDLDDIVDGSRERGGGGHDSINSPPP